MNTNLIFYDVDTQKDFMNKNGRLYVPGAELINPKLKFLTAYARAHKIPLIGSEDWHYQDDPEISDQPDYVNTFPAHCMAGTEGQKRIMETRPLDPLFLNRTGIWYKGRRVGFDAVKSRIGSGKGELYFRKQENGVAGHKYVDSVFGTVNPKVAIVYGVATDFCVAKGIEYLIERNIDLYVVQDAIKGIVPENTEKTYQFWKKNGVKTIRTDQIKELIEAIK